jgi:hypothetical protein
MRPNGVALCRMADGANDGATYGWIGIAPFDRDWVDAERVRVRGETNGLIGLRDFGDWNAIVFCSTTLKEYDVTKEKERNEVRYDWKGEKQGGGGRCIKAVYR